MAIYSCRTCEKEQFVPRRFRYHLGPTCRCPICGSYRVVRLKQPDKIDRKHGGFLNMLERLAGKGRLFHCRWCRLQFFDRRTLATDVKVAIPETEVTDMQVAIPETEVVRAAEKTAGSAQ